MSVATLAPDVQRAVTDLAYYDEQVKQLEGPEHKAFVDAVIAAHRAVVSTLTDTDRAILEFARDRLPYFRTKGALEQAVLYQFEFTSTRYYQRLNTLVNRPEAAEAYPVVVKRLRERRALRQAQRSNRSSTGSAA